MSAEPEPHRARQVLAITCGATFTVRRAYRWAVQGGVPVYAHIRGLWLLARALRIQAEDRAPRGGPEAMLGAR